MRACACALVCIFFLRSPLVGQGQLRVRDLARVQLAVHHKAYVCMHAMYVCMYVCILYSCLSGRHVNSTVAVQPPLSLPLSPALGGAGPTILIFK